MKKIPLVEDDYPLVKKKERKQKQYKFTVWIHPKEGGDDFVRPISIVATSLSKAEKILKEYISDYSTVTNDYWLQSVID